MKYIEFKTRFQKAPIIISKDAEKQVSNKQVFRNQLNRWHKKGLIVKLKRGVYLLNENDRKNTPGLMFIANQLYNPSYISLESALSYYDLIPERVADVTSVSTRKTAHFENKLGLFAYQQIKPGAFRGFRLTKDENEMPLLLAEPEKAIVDFLYLNLSRFSKKFKEQFNFSYRFQNTELLKENRLLEMAELFKNRKLIKVIEALIAFIKSEV